MIKQNIQYLTSLRKITLLALIAAFSLVFIGSCKKDHNEDNNFTQPEDVIDFEKNIYLRLQNFHNHIKNNMKDEMFYALDSAQWYTEAYYNVFSGYPDSAFKNFILDTSYYNINVSSNNMISSSSIATLLEEMNNNLSVVISQQFTNNAHMVLGDVIFDTSLKSSGIQVMVITGLGEGSEGMYNQIPSTECWFYGMTAGRCDLNPPTPPYEDAGDQLEVRFNNPNYPYSPHIDCSNETWMKIISVGNTYYDGRNNSKIYSEWYPGSKDYPGYYGDYWNVFLNYGQSLFNNYVSNGGLIPDGKHIFSHVDITTYDPPKQNNGVDGFDYYHGYTVFYSIYVCMPEIE